VKFVWLLTFKTRKPCYRKGDRAMRRLYTVDALDNFESPWLRSWLLFPNWMRRWKNYENRSIFSKDMDKSIVSPFLTHGVVS